MNILTTINKVKSVFSNISDSPAVVRSTNGGFEVTIDDAYCGLITHKFGNLVKDKETANRLHLADPEKRFQLGDCGSFAAQLWNLNEYVVDYLIIKTEDEPVFGTHHFVRLADGTCVDSMGLWTEEDFLNVWKAVDPTSEISTFDLDDDDDIAKNPAFPVTNPELLDILHGLISDHVKA